jgi:DNA replicative helicase MCM subunit Mcm2 (Cdc46/Mcm family)
LLISEDEEEKIKNLARDPKIYDRISKSIASSIYGHEDIKKAIAC